MQLLTDYLYKMDSLPPYMSLFLNWNIPSNK